jgi:hypothetical protein
MSLTINFSLNANSASTLTFRSVTITANKGGDGTQNGNGGAGGTASGGLYNVSGGNGQYASDDDGGGGGGGINGGVGYYNIDANSGGIGGSSSDFRNLQAALTLISASYTLGPGGNGGGNANTNTENMNGVSSTSVGAGGGGAGWYGGAGGNGYLGGGGGGSASYSVARNGGIGGSACVIIQYKTTTVDTTAVILYSSSTSYTLPSGTVTVSVWLIGNGGNGGNVSAGDGYAASGGGAGGMAYYDWAIRQAPTVLVSGAANKTIINKYLLNSSVAFGQFTTTNTDGGYTIKHTSLNPSIVTIPSNSIATATIMGAGTVSIQTEFTETANFFASSGTYVTIVIIGPNTTYVAVNMTTVDLSGTDIRNSVFSDCILQNANLYSAIINENTDFRTVNNMQNLRSGRINGITTLFPTGYKLI